MICVTSFSRRRVESLIFIMIVCMHMIDYLEVLSFSFLSYSRNGWKHMYQPVRDIRIYSRRGSYSSISSLKLKCIHSNSFSATSLFSSEGSDVFGFRNETTINDYRSEFKSEGRSNISRNDLHENFSPHHAISSSIVDGSFLELVEPETNCTVRIVGVFHGTESSARDVTKVISSSSSTSMIVLELCSDRYRDLILKKQPSSISSDPPTREAQEPATGNDSISKHLRTTTWIERYYRTVRDAINRQGWSSGLVVAVFGLVNGFQQEILKLQPGLEFTTAVEVGKNLSIPIILADQDVSITLQRISEIPSISLYMWNTLLRTGSWEKSFGASSHAFGLAVVGGWINNDNNLSAIRATRLLTLPQFLTRNLDAVQDLLKFVGIPLLFVQFLNMFLLMEDNIDVCSVSPASTIPDSLDPLVTSIMNAIVIVLFYLSVALPTTHVILSERDDVLAAGILAACRLANNDRRKSDSSDKKALEKQNDTQERIIVVVLGFLHVNGVAMKLLKK